MSRLADLKRFYSLLDRLKERVKGPQTFATLNTFADCPGRGVYFFFEPGEIRQESGSGPRVVRVGTHALKPLSRSTLRQRLSQHRGQLSGGGNHRGSIFRLLLGQALLARGGLTPCKSWGVKSDSSQACTALGIDLAALKMAETPVEKAVSQYVVQMPFLWIGINDDPGPSSLRAAIERNSVALLSNFKREPLDRPSAAWLGHCSDRALVRESGLWNQQHTEVTHDPKFLDLFEGIMERVGAN